MIAWWPGKIKAGSITEQTGHIVDFMATFIEMADATYPNKRNGETILPLEGKSLLSVFAEGKRSGHGYMAWEWSGNKAYREGDMKVVWDKLVKEWELYDLSTDRTESVNLAKSQPETTHRLIKAWHDWAARTGTRIR